MTIRLQALALVVILSAGSAFADLATWTNTTNESATWNTSANWDGIAEGTYPNGETYDVSIKPMTYDYSQRITLGDTTWTSATYTLHSVTGDANHQLLLDLKARKGQYAAKPEPFHLAIANPNGFLGFIQPQLSHAWLDMETDASFVPRYPNVDISNMLFANVTNAATRGEIDTITRGVLVKTGLGELAVRSADGADSQIRLTQGSLELGDSEAETTEELLANAAFWFDASAAKSLLTTTGDDGRLWVTNWTDVRGNGRFAYAPTTVGFGAPYLSGATSGTGLTLVDFGDLATFADEGAATNRYFRLSEQLTAGREFFYAGQYVRRNYNCVFGWHDWRYYPFHGHYSWLFSVGAAADAVSFGDIAFDGVKRRVDFEPTAYQWSKVHVMSVGALSGQPVSSIGTDRALANRTGGMRLGEVIIFTTPLTHRQRQTINRYLMKKWDSGHADCDVGAVTLSSGANEISVPAGAEAHVRRLYTGGATLVKKGEGTLRVDVINPANSAVSVEGGRVAFSGGLGTVDETQPAANPYLWLDATADSFVVSNLVDNVTNYVARWNDCRAAQTTVYARAPVIADGMSAFTGRLPFLRENAVGDLRAVNFGTGAGGALKGGDSAWLKLSVAGSPNAYAGFLVFRITNANKDQAIFGTTMGTANFSRAYQSALLNPNYAIGEQLGARWSLDGKLIDPTETKPKNSSGNIPGYFATTTEYHVAAFSADTKFRIDALAKERTDGDICGNIEIGEFILYDRRLSDDEVRATEAYLMKRWLKADHPDKASATVAPALAFGDDVPAVFETDGTTTYSTLAGGDGTILKRGSGTVTVGGITNGQLSSVSVDAGTLTLGFADEEAGLLTPAWRFDASETNRMQLVDGTSSVSNWFSSAGCTYDMHAVASPIVPVASIAARMPAYPTLVENVEFRSGISGNCLDFGSFNQTEPAPEGTTAAGFALDDLNHPGNNVCYDQCWMIREAYTIFADREGETRSMIFGTAKRNDYRYDFLRGNGGSLFSTGNSRAGVRNGYIAIDGVETNATAVLPEGFHLVSVQPVADGTEMAEKYRIDALAMDRGERGGGCRIAELVAYKGQHTARQRTFIEQSLMHKWFGTAAPKWAHAIPSITVAEGATLTLNGSDVSLTVPALAGAGTLVADRVSGVASISLTTDSSDNSIPPLTVEGELALAESGSVSISGDRIRFGADKILLLTADTLADVDLTQWTVTFPAAKASYGFRLVREGNSIYLKVQKPGLTFVIR